MREDLIKRMAAWNGQNLTEVPVEAPPKPSPNRKPSPVPPPPVSTSGWDRRDAFSSYQPETSSSPLEPAGTGDTAALAGDAPALADLLPGYEFDGGAHGRHYCIETRLHDMPDWAELGRRFHADAASPDASGSHGHSRLSAHAPERLLFFDIETAGLGDSAVFLIGLMLWDGAHFHVRQLLARNLREERSIVAETASSIGRFGALVSFNGKTFDLPFIKNRLQHHGLPPCAEADHIDLLYHARRRWRKQLPDCRLQTLEAHVCRRPRVDDVPSREIPGVYRRFLRDGDPRPLRPVLHHNLLDLVTMAELLVELRTV